MLDEGAGGRAVVQGVFCSICETGIVGYEMVKEERRTGCRWRPCDSRMEGSIGATGFSWDQTGTRPGGMQDVATGFTG